MSESNKCKNCVHCKCKQSLEDVLASAVQVNPCPLQVVAISRAAMSTLSHLCRMELLKAHDAVFQNGTDTGFDELMAIRVNAIKERKTTRVLIVGNNNKHSAGFRAADKFTGILYNPQGTYTVMCIKNKGGDAGVSSQWLSTNDLITAIRRGL